MADDDNRLRLTILGGFLGAGKSTWLRHQLFVGAYDAPHVIVNEVASHAVDDTLLVGARELDVLAGGCICCNLRDEMIALLHRVCNDRSRKQASPQTRHLVFEMSGIADPGQVMTVIQDDPILARHIALEEIIVLVDALHGPEQLKAEVLARAQIEAADRIVITKTDACNEADLAQLTATLRQINSAQSFQTADFGVEEALPNLPRASPAILPALDGDASLSPLTSMPLDLKQFGTGADIWVGFSIWLSALLHTHGDHLARVKGVVRTPGGRLLIQSVRKVMQVPERIPADHGGDRSSDDTIVLIGRGLEPERITRSLRRFIEMTSS